MKNETVKYHNARYHRIQDLRTDRDYLQADIAQYLHIRQNTYSRYETGERAIPLDVIGKLADFYKTSVDYLMGRTDVMNPYPKAEKG